MVVGYCYCSECNGRQRSRSTFKRRRAATDVGMLPHVFPSSRLLLLSSPQYPKQGVCNYSTVVCRLPPAIEEASLPTGVAWNICFYIEEMIARAHVDKPKHRVNGCWRQRRQSKKAVHRGFSSRVSFPLTPNPSHLSRSASLHGR